MAPVIVLRKGLRSPNPPLSSSSSSSSVEPPPKLPKLGGRLLLLGGGGGGDTLPLPNLLLNFCNSSSRACIFKFSPSDSNLLTSSSVKPPAYI